MDSSSSATSQHDQHDDLSEADLAQTWKELQKGEKTAQALETNLSSLEKKLDDLLATFDEKQLAQLEQLEAATSAGKKNANIKVVGAETAESSSKA